MERSSRLSVDWGCQACCLTCPGPLRKIITVMNKDQLIQLLAQQIKYATGLDGKIGIDPAEERRKACDEANSTLHLLETKFKLDPERVYYQAEDIALAM